MESLIDMLGKIIWASTFVAPLVIMPLVWKFLDKNKRTRIMTGLILSAVVSYLLFCIGLAIIFRNGMGPG